MLIMDIYSEFVNWLDNILENNDMPDETVSFCFNLYEESVEDSVYAVQLVACEAFDENDPDWACEECWSSEEDIFCVELSDEAEKDWKAAQKLITGWAEEYLERGKYASILTSKPVGIGFVDGDLEIIHR
ncbi:MAG: hypothetical protein IJB68_11725 [Ruminococcus sp.]|nr:hypothetical protein [Ruminococcus sp.]